MMLTDTPRSSWHNLGTCMLMQEKVAKLARTTTISCACARNTRYRNTRKEEGKDAACTGTSSLVRNSKLPSRLPDWPRASTARACSHPPDMYSRMTTRCRGCETRELED